MASHALLVLLLASAASSELSQTSLATLTCPDNYVILDASCFHVTEESFNGTDAKTACPDGGVPALIDSQREMDLLKGSFLDSTVYIGENPKQYRENPFLFMFKMAGRMRYHNHAYYTPEEVKACVLMDAAQDYTWRDEVCSAEYPVLCKATPAVTACTPSCPEGPGHHRYDSANGTSSCLWVDESEKYNHLKALKLCSTLGMQLAKVDDEKMNEVIHGFSNSRLWIGLDRLEVVEGSPAFRWVDGTDGPDCNSDAETNLIQKTNNWAEGYPKCGEAGGENHCVFKDAESKWMNYNCELLNGVVCRGPLKGC